MTPQEWEAGHTYRFYSVATDNVGHVKSVPGTPDASTQIGVYRWHNALNALDVTGPGGVPDGAVVPADALAIANYINAFGAGAVPSGAISGSLYLDTAGGAGGTGDDFVAPNDVLAIIDFINAFGSGLPGPAGEEEGSTAGPATAIVGVTAINDSSPPAAQPTDFFHAEASATLAFHALPLLGRPSGATTWSIVPQSPTVT